MRGKEQPIHFFTRRSRKKGCAHGEENFKHIFLLEKFCIFIEFSFKTALARTVPPRQSVGKTLSGAILWQLIDTYWHTYWHIRMSLCLSDFTHDWGTDSPYIVIQCHIMRCPINRISLNQAMAYCHIDTKSLHETKLDHSHRTLINTLWFYQVI